MSEVSLNMSHHFSSLGIHEKSFIGFAIFSWLYLVTTCMLFRIQKNKWVSIEWLNRKHISRVINVYPVQFQEQMWHTCKEAYIQLHATVLLGQVLSRLLSVRHHVQKNGKWHSLKKFGYIQDNALLFRPKCCPLLVHLWQLWPLHLNT